MTNHVLEDLDDALEASSDTGDDAFVKLFNRWEQQQWRSLSIDLERDRATWARMPAMLRMELHFAVCELGAGDVAVTRLLLPLIEHAPHETWQLFLATQLSDEARHAMFFSRYYDEVLGGEVLASSAAATVRRDFDDSAYETEFTPVLAAAVGGAHEGTASWHYASTLYHLITEGVLGIAVLKIGRKLTANPRLLPGLAEGVMAVFRDESRHITFGRRAAMAGVAAGYGGAIAEAYEAGIRAAARVAVAPGRFEVPLPGPAADQRARELSSRLGQTCERAIRQARVLRLPIARDALRGAWSAACDEAFDDYAERWGREHSLAPVVSARAA